jgi:hypothetical protein
MLSLSISYPDLIKFHGFAYNSQEGMKHQMRGATQARQGMALWISVLMYPPNLLLMTSSGAPPPPPFILRSFPFAFGLCPMEQRDMLFNQCASWVLTLIMVWGPFFLSFLYFLWSLTLAGSSSFRGPHYPITIIGSTLLHDCKQWGVCFFCVW